MTPPTIRITRREDLLGYVPYTLGFHPADSIVLLGESGNRLTLSARTDADQPTRETIRLFCRVLARSRSVSGVFVIGYGPDIISGPTRSVADALVQRGWVVHEVLRVADGRYHCLSCDGCTAPGGERFDGSATQAATAAVVAGLVARPSRDDVRRLVNPIGGLAAMAMTQAVDRAEQRLGTLRNSAEVIEAGRRAVDEALRKAEAGEGFDDDEVAWLSVLMVDTAVRDHAWMKTDAEDWQLEFWLSLTRRSEPVLAAPMATLLGWCAWRQGDAGALTTAALQRALRIDPDYSLAQLLLDAVQEGQPPTAIAEWPLGAPTSPVVQRGASSHTRSV